MRIDFEDLSPAEALDLKQSILARDPELSAYYAALARFEALETTALIGPTRDETAGDLLVVVDTLIDEDDGNYSSGDLSLREALTLVSAGGTITFSRAITGGTTRDVDDGIIRLQGSALSITQDVILNGDTNGDGRADITLQAAEDFRVMTASGSETDLDIFSLTLSGATTYSYGAGIYAEIATLDIVNSAIQDNYSYGFGGGMLIRNTDLRMINSTLQGNTAYFGSGGMSMSGGTALLDNVTVSGNSVFYYTGGLSLGGPTEIRNSTITNNSAIFDVGGIGGTSVDIINSIVAGNSALGDAQDIAPADFAGYAAHSIFGTSVTLLDDQGGNIFTDEPGLARLADNAGPVITHALELNSLAIDAGDAALLGADIFDLDGDGELLEAVPLDANGAARLLGPLDIGATEYDAAAFTVTRSDSAGILAGKFITIHSALDRALSGDTIDVAEAYDFGPENAIAHVNNLRIDIKAGDSVAIALSEGGMRAISSTGAGTVSFTGNSSSNHFTLGPGADSVAGGDGSDTVDYSNSDSRVAVNLLFGTATSGFADGDALSDIENLIGSDGNDLLVGDALANELNGGDGIDNINGRSGADTLLGGDGNDLIYGASHDDSVNGGTGDDRLYGNGGVDSITGETGADTIFGGAGADTLLGGEHTDSILGQGGDDVILGGSDTDILRGGSGNDDIAGGGGDDTLFGNGNNDTIMGGEGNDSLQGNAGQDWLIGGAGDDTLFGGAAGDRLDGGTGNDLMNAGTNDGVRDVFVYLLGYDQDRINQFDQLGDDRLELDHDLWQATMPDLSAQAVVDTFGTMNSSGTILSLDFGGGDVLEIQNSSGIDAAHMGLDLFII